MISVTLHVIVTVSGELDAPVGTKVADWFKPATFAHNCIVMEQDALAAIAVHVFAVTLKGAAKVGLTSVIATLPVF